MIGEVVAEETITISETPTTNPASDSEGMIGAPVEDCETEANTETKNEAQATTTNPPDTKEKIIVRSIEYNEKGQRIRINYGNHIATKYEYDPDTFRLVELKSYNSNKEGGGEVLQDLHYTYDPIGNITTIADKAIPTTFFNNQKIAAQNDYTYDALYRLTKAEGREHIGQQNFGQNDNWQDLPFLKKYSGGDALTWRNYTQAYQYDAVGNILQMRHVAETGSWTRDYQYETHNNRLQQTQVGEQVYLYPHHKQHGFITALPHLQRMDWNFRDELQAVAKQKVGEGAIPETTYYVYDAKGQRVRKVTENNHLVGEAATPKKERLYLGNLEIYRVHSGQHKGLERSSLHVTEYFPPASKIPEEPESENTKPLTEEKQKTTPTLGAEDTIATIAKRTASGLLSSVFHPSLVMGKRIALLDTRNAVEDGTELSTLRYQLSNHLESVALELDGAGQVVSYEEYHPYGTTAYQAVSGAVQVAAKRYRYTGKERDGESGLYYHGARYYVCWLGRWLKPDPGGMLDGINDYNVNSNLKSFIDQSGFNGKTPEEIERQLKEAKEKYSGDLFKTGDIDEHADELAEFLGGESSVAFDNDPDRKEFDAINDEFIGETKNSGEGNFNAKDRTELNRTFAAAKATNRKVFLQFRSKGLSERNKRRLQRYQREFDVEVQVQTPDGNITNLANL